MLYQVSFYEDGIAGEIYGDKISDQEEMTTSDNITLTNVQCFPLYSILLAVGRVQVDYFSVDVEGSESQILMTIPWHKVDIKVYIQIDFWPLDDNDNSTLHC